MAQILLYEIRGPQNPGRMVSLGLLTERHPTLEREGNMIWWIVAGALYMIGLAAIWVFLKGATAPRQRLEEDMNQVILLTKR